MQRRAIVDPVHPGTVGHTPTAIFRQRCTVCGVVMKNDAIGLRVRAFQKFLLRASVGENSICGLPAPRLIGIANIRGNRGAREQITREEVTRSSVTHKL
jgi:hypothetical protein